MAIAAPGQLNVNESPIWGSRSVDCFEKLEQIGEGTYGFVSIYLLLKLYVMKNKLFALSLRKCQVYMAKEIKTGEIVALKKIRMDNEREGFPITAIREIKILKKLHHENVIKLKEIVTSQGPEKDEQGKPGNSSGVNFHDSFNFLCGLHTKLIHLLFILVLGIADGSNLLIDNEGNLKLADFGLARSFSNDQNANLTNRVITLWYSFDHHALELLEKMLTLDPSQRITAKDALDAEYFWTDPLPCDPKSLPKYESSHEFQTKKKRQQQRQNEEMAKRQKMQHPQPHTRLPPIQQPGQHAQMRSGPNQPIHGSQPQVSAGPTHHYGKPRGPSGGPGRYPPNGNPGGGYSHPNRAGQGGSGYGSGPYPPQGRGAPYGSNSMPGGGPRGSGASGYVGAPNYPQQGGPYGGSAAGRGSNMMGGNRNQQQYGWQQ
ncbi:hypothetical protein JHK85_005743 [Glycine max]|nr:hypothetical protein JHK85_005743 [Glycine max]